MELLLHAGPVVVTRLDHGSNLRGRAVWGRKPRWPRVSASVVRSRGEAPGILQPPWMCGRSHFQPLVTGQVAGTGRHSAQSRLALLQPGTSGGSQALPTPGPECPVLWPGFHPGRHPPPDPSRTPVLPGVEKDATPASLVSAPGPQRVVGGGGECPRRRKAQPLPGAEWHHFCQSSLYPHPHPPSRVSAQRW